MSECPDCGSDNIQTDCENKDWWQCIECGRRFPKVYETNFTSGEDQWEDEEEEMDGGLGEDLFGEDW